MKKKPPLNQNFKDINACWTKRVGMKVAIDFHIYEEYFVILHPIMTGYFKRAAMLAVIILFVAGCHTPHSGGRVDLRLRARVDSYNKQSFMTRPRPISTVSPCWPPNPRDCRASRPYAKMSKWRR